MQLHIDIKLSLKVNMQLHFSPTFAFYRVLQHRPLLHPKYDMTCTLCNIIVVAAKTSILSTRFGTVSSHAIQRQNKTCLPPGRRSCLPRPRLASPRLTSVASLPIAVAVHGLGRLSARERGDRILWRRGRSTFFLGGQASIFQLNQMRFGKLGEETSSDFERGFVKGQPSFFHWKTSVALRQFHNFWCFFLTTARGCDMEREGKNEAPRK